jgi:hypothetical protein
MDPRPDRLPSIRIAELFAVANGNREASESERREAIAQLIGEFRSQCEQAAREIKDHKKTRAAFIGEAEAAGTIPVARITDLKITAGKITTELDALGAGPVIDPLLVQGLKAWAFRIFLQSNSISVLERLLGIRRRPGKRAKNTDRDFPIAVAVAAKMKSGMTLENASYEVAEKHWLQADNVSKIYTRNREAALVQVAIDNLVAQENTAAECAEDLETDSRQTEAAKKTQNSESERDLDPRFPWRGSRL